jgi:hypothetical protein
MASSGHAAQNLRQLGRAEFAGSTGAVAKLTESNFFEHDPASLTDNERAGDPITEDFSKVLPTSADAG